MRLTSTLVISSLFFLFSCNDNNQVSYIAGIQDLNLKRGEVISCGPPESKFGSVEFQISGSEKTRKDFNLAVSLLHSFEYDEAEKIFARIIDEEPETAMAYWGVAMSNFHPLWTPPSESELVKGSKAVELARLAKPKTKREADYIEAIGSFYQDWEKLDHKSRCISFEKSMEKLNANYPDDKESSIFYALALDAAADPADKSYVKQKKAGKILESLYPDEPNHPGVVHYLIHTYDVPELAGQALPAARKYASVAPSSAHALHMPSHIFTRLGLWDEDIQSNLVSVNSAQCYAKAAGIKGHWDEELHGLDYLVYAYLQKGDNELAKKQLDYLKTIQEVNPVNFKVAYAFASIPSRFVLENKLWKEAANLKSHVNNFSWDKYQWQQAILNFTRLMGAVHLKNLNQANTELLELKNLHKQLIGMKDAYKSNQVAIQIRASEAWIKFAEGKADEALVLMQRAAGMEDSTEKHPVTPCEVIPARELLGDLMMEMKKPEKALEAYEMDLNKHPNRFNGLYGAGLAAEQSGNREKAKIYFEKLLSVTNSNSSDRNELKHAKEFLAKS